MKGIKLFSWFRKIAMVEGISYVVLLFIAMPLKYFADKPVAVKIVGYIHGALFVTLFILAYMVWDKYKKSFAWGLKAFLASIIPFGTFVMDKEWKKEEWSLEKF
jgi:integral membrane protein